MARRKKFAKRELAEAAKELLEELECGWLEVVKVPGEPNDIRAAINHNADWYKHLCNSYLKVQRGYRKPRTMIRRAHTLQALRYIVANGIDDEREYHKRLLCYIEERAAEIRERVPF